VRRAATALLGFGVLCSLATGCTPPRPRVRNVLLVSIDTLRADHVSAYGFPRPTTPNIDAVAREGVLFKNVHTPVPMTLPAHVSMLTGTLPPTHGLRDNLLSRLPEGSEDDLLRPSPGGTYVALLAPGRPGVSVFTRTGARAQLPMVPSPRTIAWSPDDDWTALATLESVYVFRSGEEENTLPRIPLAVRDLDWDA